MHHLRGVAVLIGIALGTTGVLAVPTAHATAVRVSAATPAPLLRRGDTGDAVARWQERLNQWLIPNPSHGVLDVDGIYGPYTESATIALQRAAMILVDGIVGPQTRGALEQLVAPELGELPYILQPGAIGAPVAQWQEALNSWLARDPSAHPQLVVDGIFGPNTEAATRAFQSASGITVDGIVGPETRGALAASR